jgi:hypothetical protein
MKRGRAKGEGEMNDNDPNEAYEVVPIEPGPRGLGGPSSGTGFPSDTFPGRKRLSGTRPIRNTERALLA